MLAELTDAVTSIVGDHGLTALFVLMVAEALLPVPASEAIVMYAAAIAAGAFANQQLVLFGTPIEPGFTAYLVVALTGIVGYTLGAVAGWAIGRYGGRPFLERHGRWLRLDAARLDRAEQWFERWGGWAVFLGRIAPVARSFVSIPAGVLEAPFGRYVALTVAGISVWCFAVAGAGYLAGANWETLDERLGIVDYVVAAVIVVGIAWLGWKVVRSRRAGKEAAPGYTDPSE
jgi:membrane protein DedA with SNARE-associated domain